MDQEETWYDMEERRRDEEADRVIDEMLRAQETYDLLFTLRSLVWRVQQFEEKLLERHPEAAARVIDLLSRTCEVAAETIEEHSK